MEVAARLSKPGVLRPASTHLSRLDGTVRGVKEKQRKRHETKCMRSIIESSRGKRRVREEKSTRVVEERGYGGLQCCGGEVVGGLGGKIGGKRQK